MAIPENINKNHVLDYLGRGINIADVFYLYLLIDIRDALRSLDRHICEGIRKNIASKRR